MAAPIFEPCGNQQLRPESAVVDGFARHMRDALPNASFIGFTGTPIENTDANTRAVFGEYISVYDIQRAVWDGATVPIYYCEGRSKSTAGAGRNVRRLANFLSPIPPLARRRRLSQRTAHDPAQQGAGHPAAPRGIR
jgi:hypothetical protein